MVSTTMSAPERPAAASAAPQAAYRIARFPPTTDQNPYQRLLYRHLRELGVELVPDAVFTLGWLRRNRGRVALLHFHWRPDRYYFWPDDYDCPRRPPRPLRHLLGWPKLAGFTLRLAIARTFGYTVVWTIHEVFPQTTTSRALDRAAARVLCRLSHVRFAHDAATVERARREIGRAVGDVHVVPHGSYVGVYPPGRPRDVVRAELGIAPSTFAFLFFGVLRAGKQIDLLLDAFAGLDGDVALIVAGVPSHDDSGALVEAYARSDPRIVPLLIDVPVDRVAELFAACDATVHPRGDGWTSGSLVLALSQGTPPVVARLSAYEELTNGGAAGWLFEPNDVASLRRALATAAADPARARRKGTEALRLAESLSWSEVARATVAHLPLPVVSTRRIGRLKPSEAAARAPRRSTTRRPEGRSVPIR